MRYRTKLYFFLVGISVTVLLVALTIIISQARHAILEDIKNQSISIAATVASNLDGDLVEQIKTAEDEKKPAYAQLQKILRKARNANRFSGIYVKYLYTIYPDPKNPTQFLFGVDAEETEKDISPPGSLDPGATDDLLFENLNERYSSGKFIQDQWGNWLTGYAPIYDTAGNYVGTVGVDISYNFVLQVQNQMYVYGAITLIISTFLSLIGAALLSRRASFALNVLKETTSKISKGDFTARADVQTEDEFHDLAHAINTMSAGLVEKERMKTGFARYVSQHVMEKIMAQGAPSLGGERRKITVFFCDIVDFTKISETLPPEEVLGILNEYFQVMLNLIFKHNGMLDKLIGDSIMAEFGYPTDEELQEKNAVLAALEMQHAITLLRSKWAREGKPALHIGIGIHTGLAVVGTLGSEHRGDFTAVGDTVNIASRLERETRKFKEKIIVSEATLSALHNEFPHKKLGSLKLTGKEQPIEAYAILPIQ